MRFKLLVHFWDSGIESIESRVQYISVQYGPSNSSHLIYIIIQDRDSTGNTLTCPGIPVPVLSYRTGRTLEGKLGRV